MLALVLRVLKTLLYGKHTLSGLSGSRSLSSRSLSSSLSRLSLLGLVLLVLSRGSLLLGLLLLSKKSSEDAGPLARLRAALGGSLVLLLVLGGGSLLLRLGLLSGLGNSRLACWGLAA